MRCLEPNEEIYNEDWKTNRIKKRELKRVIYWCNCDLDMVEHGKKCKTCGKRTDGNSRDKK